MLKNVAYSWFGYIGGFVLFVLLAIIIGDTTIGFVVSIVVLGVCLIASLLFFILHMRELAFIVQQKLLLWSSYIVILSSIFILLQVFSIVMLGLLMFLIAIIMFFIGFTSFKNIQKRTEGDKIPWFLIDFIILSFL